MVYTSRHRVGIFDFLVHRQAAYTTNGLRFQYSFFRPFEFGAGCPLMVCSLFCHIISPTKKGAVFADSPLGERRIYESTFYGSIIPHENVTLCYFFSIAHFPCSLYLSYSKTSRVKFHYFFAELFQSFTVHSSHVGEIIMHFHRNLLKALVLNIPSI